MKKLPLLFGALAMVLLLNSCEKCADCACVSSITFEFDEAIPEATQESITNSYTNDFNSNYPENSKEICTKKKELPAAMEDYTSQSATFDEENTSAGNPWTVKGIYNCVCTEQ